MDENKNNSNLTPEEELDLLLAKFLAEDDTAPEAPPAIADEAPLSEEVASEDVLIDLFTDEEVAVEDVSIDFFADEEIQEAPCADAALPEEEEETLTIWQGPETAEVEEPVISEEALWENIDAEDPSTGLDTNDIDPVEFIPEIGPDEEALAGIELTHPEDVDLLLDEEDQPDWALEPTAIIPELPHSVSQSIVLEDGMFDDDSSSSADPLNDPALRQLLFEETASFKDDEFRDTFGEVEEIYSSAPAPAPEQEAASQPINTPVQPEESLQEATPVRKKRPKNKNAYGLLSIPHIISTLIWLVLVVAIGASLGRMLWLCASDVLAFGRPDQTVYITITKTDTLDTVAEKLHRAGLINYPGLFKLYGKLSNIMDDLSIGTYELNTLYDYHALSTSMSEKPAMRVTVTVTIPEGYNCAQIFALLEEKEVCTVAELEKYAETSEFADYWFLEGTPRGDKYCLEGFLFPDTYEFYVDSDAKEVYIKLLAAFDYRFTDTMKDKLVKLNEYLSAKMKKNGFDQAYIDSHQMTIREIVIIASLIEKESSGIEDDSYNISSVIYNRLTNISKYPYLGLNSTLVYYTGRTELTSEDFKDDHPYNTYTRKGLTPGPIANPGRASLDAALDPSDTAYYYFILNPKTGTHEYSKTYEEHQQKAEEFERLNG